MYSKNRKDEGVWELFWFTTIPGHSRPPKIYFITSSLLLVICRDQVGVVDSPFVLIDDVAHECVVCPESS